MPDKEVYLIELEVAGNYVWCLYIVVIFTGFGGTKSWGNVLKLSFGVAKQAAKEGGQFLWGKRVFTM